MAKRKETQVIIEGGKGSWVPLFTHFHIRKIKKIAAPIKYFLRNKGAKGGREIVMGQKDQGARWIHQSCPFSPHQLEVPTPLWKLFTEYKKLLSQQCADGSQVPNNAST